MEVKWQDIVEKMKRKGIKLNRSKGIVRNYYHAFQKSISTTCDIPVKHIGRFKACSAALREEEAQWKADAPIRKHKDKLAHRRWKMWLFEEFDNYWPE